MAERHAAGARSGDGLASAPPPIVRTKLRRPELLPATLLRPRLAERLVDGLSRRLLLLAAPAGYGKTTLLAQALSQVMGGEGDGWQPGGSGASPLIPHPPPLAYGWLTLDEADNEPRRFLAYLIAAVPGLGEASRARMAGSLRGVAPPDAEAVIADLLNDLSELAHETVIVLDDYHLIQAPAIHRALAFIVDHLPPRAHLVLATRTDPPLPVARLRARGHLAELRAADLRFSQEETAAFLLETMALPLAREQLVALVERTEGWPAGLHLAAIALRDRPDHGSLVDALVGGHRYIVDYLIEDVFARLPAHTQTFLLQTSILDRLCGPLCDAVVGMSQGGRPVPPAALAQPEEAFSRLILDALERDNLFLVPLDAERVWYRYHHLFAEVLRERLLAGTPAEQVITLHRRASAWHAAHGMITEAVGHALKAGAVEDVVAIIEPVGLAMATRVGEATLRGWFPGIPDAVVRAHPRVALLRAWVALADYDRSEAEGWLRVAEEALARVAAGETAAIGNVANLRGEVAAVRARLATHAGDAAEVVTCAGQALAWLQADNAALRARVAKDLGYAHMVRGDYARAESAFADAMASGLGTGSSYVMFMATSDYAFVRALRGAHRDASAACRRAIAEASAAGALGGPGSGLPFLALADVAGARLELAGALPALAEAAARIAPGNTTSYICLLIVEARVARAQGDPEAALGSLRRARHLAQQRRLLWPAPILDALEAQLQLDAGDLSGAGMLLARVNPDLPPAEFRFFPPAVLFAAEHCATAPLQLRLARARALGAHAELRELLGELEDLVCAADQAGLGWRRVKLRLLLALAFAGLGREGQGLAVLERAVALAAPEGYGTPFREEGPPLANLLARLASEHGDAETRARANELLARIGAPLAAPPPADLPAAPGLEPAPAAAPVVGLPEPLSSRELEVLRLMADGRSNSEISADLTIAVSTVKSHVNSIFGKLGVATRTQALARARRLGVI